MGDDDSCRRVVYILHHSHEEDVLREILIYGAIYLIVIYIFILMVLRAVFYTFVVKSDPLKSLKIVDKPKGLFKIYKKEKQEEANAKWG